MFTTQMFTYLSIRITDFHKGQISSILYHKFYKISVNLVKNHLNFIKKEGCWRSITLPKLIARRYFKYPKMTRAITAYKRVHKYLKLTLGLLTCILWCR